VEHQNFIQWLASIGGRILQSLGLRRRNAYTAPRAVMAAALPARRVFSGPDAYLPSAVVAAGDRRAPLINARTPVLVGVIIILVAFVGIGGWAAIAPIDSAAIASGTVAIESGRQTIQHLEGGIIKQILVQDGDHVKAGDVLVRMDDTRTQAELSLVQGELDLAEATYARLSAERDGLGEPKYPARLLARASDPEVAELLAGQSNLFTARLAVLNGQKDILRQQVAQYQQQIKGYQAIEVSKQTQLSLVKTELSDLSGLLQQGYVTKSRVLALQRQEGELEGERGQSIAEIARAQQGIGESNRQILQLDNQRQEDISKDLHALEGQLNELRQKLIAAKDVVERLNITAPIDGTVTNLSIHTVGGVIGTGAQLMEIVPADDKLIVEAEISPIDINTVHVGQEVSVRVVAAGARLLPVIYGRLEEISADRMTVPNTAAGPGRIYYQARISISPEQAARLGDVKLRVGMPVEAMITRGSQTALHYAIKPMLDSLSKSFREQ
jgi:HlyD family type I secretion membrane fusion protein